MNFIFYLIYRLLIESGEAKQFPEITSALAFSMILSFNIFAFVNLGKILGISFFLNFEWSNDKIIILGFLSLLFSGYKFLNNKSYKKIKVKFDKERKNVKMLKFLLVSLYFSVILFLIFYKEVLGNVSN